MDGVDKALDLEPKNCLSSRTKLPASLTSKEYSTRRMLQPRMDGLIFCTRRLLPRHDAQVPEMMWLPLTEDSF